MDLTKEELIAYLEDCSSAELESHVESVSPAVAGYIEDCINSLLGSMRAAYGTKHTVLIEGNQLEALIRSSMVSGYLAKSGEDRLLIAKNFKNLDAA